MSLLNFHDNSSNLKGEKKTLKLLFGIGALVGVIALGSTLAASINLNSNGPVEFGQGIAQTVACDSDGITLTPYSTFNNDSQNSDFYFSSLEVANVSSNCSGVTFKLRAYMNGNNTPLAWPAAPNGDSFEFGFTASEGWRSVDSCMALNNQETGSSSDNSVTIEWGDCETTLAGEVDRLTLESSNNPNPGYYPLQVGDVGPAGGVIFYSNINGFDCGIDLDSTCYFLEAAPKTWSGGGIDLSGAWCENTGGISGTLASIGSGRANTELIKTGCTGTTIATIVSDLSFGGEDDWFIPSENEAAVFYTQRDLFTGSYQLSGDSVNSDPARYLTSTQYAGFPADNFMYLKWFNGVSEAGYKPGAFSVRPIRAF
jgi:hypothetical protein